MKTKLFLLLIIALILGLFSSSAMTQCLTKKSLSTIGTSSSYTACNSEMKTTFTWEVPPSGGTYPMISASVNNTPFYETYIANELCPGGGCSGSEVEWNHCTTLTNHYLEMDGTTGMGGFTTYVLTAQYFADQPD